MRILVKGTIFESEMLNEATGKNLKRGYMRKQLALYERNFECDYDRYHKTFMTACKALGAAIVQAGYEIVVGVSQWYQLQDGKSVESYVIQGANEIEITGKHRIIFFTPQEPEPPDATPNEIDTLQELRKLPNITIEQRYLGRGHWGAGMIGDVHEADAVILIGGTGSTASIGYTAYSFGKPVIPITWFGGAAYDISENIIFNQWVNNGDFYQLNAEEVACTQNQWQIEAESESNRSAAGDIVSLTTKLVKYARQLQSNSIRVVRLTIALLIAFMFLWLSVFLRGSQVLLLEKDIVFFLLLFIASIVGTGLRTLVSYSNDQVTTLTFTRLAIDVAVGLGLALAFALFYFIGGVSFTGEVIVLDSEQIKETFPSIAVTMSLLGLAAGFLLPVEHLKQRLEDTVSHKEEIESVIDVAPLSKEIK